MDWAKTAARQDEKDLGFGIWCDLSERFVICCCLRGRYSTLIMHCRACIVNGHFGHCLTVRLSHHMPHGMYQQWCARSIDCINHSIMCWIPSWWRHQMETYSALLALCAENSPVIGEFPAQRSVMLSFDIFFGLRLNKRFSKQSRRWWFEMQSSSLWRHSNV